MIRVYNERELKVLNEVISEVKEEMKDVTMYIHECLDNIYKRLNNIVDFDTYEDDTISFAYDYNKVIFMSVDLDVLHRYSMNSFMELTVLDIECDMYKGIIFTVEF